MVFVMYLYSVIKALFAHLCSWWSGKYEKIFVSQLMLKNMDLHLYDSDKLSSALRFTPEKSHFRGGVEGAGATITSSGEIGNLKRNTHRSEKLLSLISPLKENWKKVKRRQHWDRNWKQCPPKINQTINVFIHKNSFFPFCLSLNGLSGGIPKIPPGGDWKDFQVHQTSASSWSLRSSLTLECRVQNR